MVQRAWSKQEVSFLQRCYKKYQIKQIAKALDRTEYSVHWKIQDLNLPSIFANRRYTAKRGVTPDGAPTITNPKKITVRIQNSEPSEIKISREVTKKSSWWKFWS